MSVATYEDVKNLSDDTVLVDVREPSELQETGILPKSINIPLGQLEHAFNLSDDEFKAKYGIAKPTTDQCLIFSCKLGGRAQRATDAMLQMGYANSKCYKGSWKEWAEKNNC